MAPILEELRKDYAGRLTVDFIDIKLSPELAQAYSVQLIPTQIFFDANGSELFRHEGFYAKEDILKKWKTLGVNLSQQEPTAGGARETSPLTEGK
jgi:thioredoxin 1